MSIWNQDFIKNSNLKRYQRMFKATNSYDWLVKYAEEKVVEDISDSFSIQVPSVFDLIKILKTSSNPREKDKVQKTLGKIVSLAWAEYLTENVNGGLPAAKTWRYVAPLEAFEDYVTDINLDVLQAKSISLLKRLSNEKLKKQLAKILTNNFALKNAINYAAIVIYDRFYALLTYNNPVIYYLPQKIDYSIPLTVKKNAQVAPSGIRISAEFPLSKLAARPSSNLPSALERFKVVSRTSARLDDLITAFRISLAKTYEKFLQEKDSKRKNNLAKAILLYNIHIEHNERALSALQQMMKDPNKRKLSHYGADYLTDNPYIANHEYIGIPSSSASMASYIRGVGPGTYKKKSESGKYDNLISYAAHDGQIRYWEKPLPESELITQYTDNIFKEEGVASSFKKNLALNTIISLINFNDYEAAAQNNKTLIDYFINNLESRGVRQALNVYSTIRRLVATELRKLSDNLLEDPQLDPSQQYSNNALEIRQKVLSYLESKFNEVGAQKDYYEFLQVFANNLVYSSIENINDIMRRSAHIPAGQKQPINDKFLSSWRNVTDESKKNFGDVMPADVLGQTLNSSFFNFKYAQNAEAYESWEVGSTNAEYVLKVSQDVKKITSDLLKKLEIVVPEGKDALVNINFLNSVRKFMRKHDTYYSVHEAIKNASGMDIHPSAFFAKLGQLMGLSFGDDFLYMTSIRNHIEFKQTESLLSDEEKAEAAPQNKEIENAFNILKSREIRHKAIREGAKQNKTINSGIAYIINSDVSSYFQDLLSEEELVKSKKRSEALDPYTYGGMLESFYLGRGLPLPESQKDKEFSKLPWQSLEDEKEEPDAFYTILLNKASLSFGNHVKNRGRLLAATFKASRGGENALPAIWQEVGVFADPYRFYIKEEGRTGIIGTQSDYRHEKDEEQEETVRHAWERFFNISGNIPPELIISTAQKYFRNQESEAIAKGFGSLIVKYDLSRPTQTFDPFKNDPRILSIKNKYLKPGKITRSWIVEFAEELKNTGTLSPKAQEEIKVLADQKIFDNLFKQQVSTIVKDKASALIYIDELSSDFFPVDNTKDTRQEIKNIITNTLTEKECSNLQALKANLLRKMNKQDNPILVEYFKSAFVIPPRISSKNLKNEEEVKSMTLDELKKDSAFQKYRSDLANIFIKYKICSERFEKEIKSSSPSLASLDALKKTIENLILQGANLRDDVESLFKMNRIIEITTAFSETFTVEGRTEIIDWMTDSDEDAFLQILSPIPVEGTLVFLQSEVQENIEKIKSGLKQTQPQPVSIPLTVIPLSVKPSKTVEPGISLTTDSDVQEQPSVPAEVIIKELKEDAPKQEVHDFEDGLGLVPAHRHSNGGGWVANTAIVEANAFVGPEAQVYGNAHVMSGFIDGEAEVFGNAVISDSAQIYGQAKVYDKAQISGEAEVLDAAEVFGEANIFGDARIVGNARISGKVMLDEGEVSGVLPELVSEPEPELEVKPEVQVEPTIEPQVEVPTSTIEEEPPIIIGEPIPETQSVLLEQAEELNAIAFRIVKDVLVNPNIKMDTKQMVNETLKNLANFTDLLKKVTSADVNPEKVYLLKNEIIQLQDLTKDLDKKTEIDIYKMLGKLFHLFSNQTYPSTKALFLKKTASLFIEFLTKKMSALDFERSLIIKEDDGFYYL